MSVPKVEGRGRAVGDRSSCRQTGQAWQGKARLEFLLQQQSCKVLGPRLPREPANKSVPLSLAVWPHHPAIQPERCCHCLFRDWPTGNGQESQRPTPTPRSLPSAPVLPQTIAKTPTAHPDSRLLLLLLLRQHALFALLCAPSKTPACIRSSLCCELIEDQSNLSQAPLLGPTIWFPSDGHSERHIYPAACLPMIALCSPVSGENTTRIAVTSQTRLPS